VNKGETWTCFWPDEYASGEVSGTENDPSSWGDLWYTRPGLVINEVFCLGSGNTEWVELYNKADVPVRLNGMRLTDQETNHIKNLPDRTIAAGDYVVIYSGTGPDDATKGSGNSADWWEFYFGDIYGADDVWETTDPNDGDDVLLHYIGNDCGIDYMQYGDTAGSTRDQPCPSDDASTNSWGGTAPPVPATDRSIGRDKDSTDTDDGSDWESSGGVDVTIPPWYTEGKRNFQIPEFTTIVIPVVIMFVLWVVMKVVRRRKKL
jgi:hypothetical protein